MDKEGALVSVLNSDDQGTLRVNSLVTNAILFSINV